MLTNQFKKEGNSSKINIYKSIPNVDDKYINRVLIESCPINILERILFKEDTSRILKFAKAKLKINSKRYTKEQIKELGVLYLEDDVNKNLYNTISNENIISMNKLFSIKFSERQITLDVFNDEEEFVKNINILLSEINVFLLISYIRAKHDNLFNIIPYILKELEDSNVYKTSGMKDAGYKINFKEKFLQKYGFKLDFKVDYYEKNNKQKVSLNITESKISSNINNIITELQNISNIFETLDTDKIKVEVLENDLKENKKLLRKSKNQILKNENELKELKEKLDISNLELEDKKMSIENLHKTIKAKAEKESELKIQINQLNKSIKDIEKSSNKQLKNIQKNLDESLQKESNLSTVCENLKNTEEQLKKNVDELKEELIATSNLLKNSLDINKNLEHKNKELILKIKELELIINNRNRSTISETSNDIQEQSLIIEDKDYNDDICKDFDDLIINNPDW